MQFRSRQDSVKTDRSYIFYFCSRVGGGGWCGEVDIKAISASNQVEVEVEVELGNIVKQLPY